MQFPFFRLSGDCAILAVFGDAISPEINARVRAFDAAVKKAAIAGVVESVTAYCSVAVHYRPEIISFQDLRDRLSALSNQPEKIGASARVVIEIPVAYGGEYGPDIKFVAQNAGLSQDDVVRMHTEPEYLIYMMGFMPGFTYLGGLNPKLNTPRLKTPRLKIPAGSVGIAGSQTGAYPVDSPGGWQLIGRTPVKLYDPAREKPILLDAGEYVKFVAVSPDEFRRIAALSNSGKYEPTRREEAPDA